MKPKDYFQKQNKQLGELYEEEAGPRHRYYVRVKARHMAGLAKRFLKNTKNLSCLSIGCGTGEAEVHYSCIFSKVVGIDYSGGMIAKAKKLDLKGTTFMKMDATKLTFKDDSFDVVVIFNVLHHVPSYRDLLGIIKEAGRVLRKEGILLVYEMNPLNPMARHIVKTMKIDKDVNLGGFERDMFPTTLKPKQLKGIAEKTGLMAAEKDYLVFFPQFLSFLNPLENILSKVPIGGLYAFVFRKL